ncbi:hypothetical protein [Janthinobacterium agaricidamnosum]|nr:hypothetical protein [Janthinobacterium agaricidamnosum]
MAWTQPAREINQGIFSCPNVGITGNAGQVSGDHVFSIINTSNPAIPIPGTVEFTQIVPGQSKIDNLAKEGVRAYTLAVQGKANAMCWNEVSYLP